MRHSPSDLAAQLRFVDIRDCDDTAIEQLRRLRNDPQIRQFLYTTHEIEAAEHQAWVKSVSADPMRRVFAVFGADTIIGSVNWSRHGVDKGVVAWGFYVDPQLAGKGVGTAMLTRFVAMIFADPSICRIRGEALAANTASIALHKRLGFVEQGRKSVSVEGNRDDAGAETADAIVFELDRAP